MISQGLHPTLVFGKAVDLFYHVELGLQFQDMSVQRKDHDHGKKERDKAVRKANKEHSTPAICYDTVMRQLQQEHLQIMMQAGSFVTFPRGSDGASLALMDMDGRLHSTPGSASAVVPIAIDAALADASTIEVDDGGAAPPHAMHAEPPAMQLAVPAELPEICFFLKC